MCQFMLVTQISNKYKCMKVKQFEADNRLFNILYRLLEFWSINRLFGESAQL